MTIYFDCSNKMFMGERDSPLEFNKEFIQLYIYGVNDYDCFVK